MIDTFLGIVGMIAFVTMVGVVLLLAVEAADDAKRDRYK